MSDKICIQSKSLKFGLVVNLIYIIVYLAIIIYITIFNRSVSILSQTSPYPFWSYRLALLGDVGLATEILENIILFIPLGFLVKRFQCKTEWIVISCFVLSFSIELIQRIFHLGLFEFDDMLNNALGAFLGTFICRKLSFPYYKYNLLVGVIILCSVVFCFTLPKSEGEVVQKKFFFEVTSCNSNKERITLNGYCFLYEKPEEPYELLLCSTDNMIRINADTSLPSDDINTYFLCDKEYTKTGFSFTADYDYAENYELIVKWDNGITSSTGVYIKKGEIVYTLADAPDYPATLLISEPDHDFYVYQNEGYLYWLCGNDFQFENDGSTLIQYQLWTTQTENLPTDRLTNDWLWDNIGFNFEEYEIISWNGYRVAKKSIPTEYSVTTIVTGYYKEGKWIWKDYFRPIVFDIPDYPYVKGK